MTQDEKLTWLIKYLLNENKRYTDIEIPESFDDKFNLYRSLVNVRMPDTISEEYLNIEDEFLTSINKVTDINSLTPIKNDIYLWQGDITTINADAIVNAANSELLGCFVPLHTCIDNCIHTFAGVRLRLACNDIMQKQGYPEPNGNAKITPAFNLPSKYVLHTVGPIISGAVSERNKMQLTSCYLKCLELAEKNECKSIAFCCISTGVFCYPNKLAAKVAVDTVNYYKKENNSKIKVIFNVFKDKDYEIYTKLLG